MPNYQVFVCSCTNKNQNILPLQLGKHLQKNSAVKALESVPAHLFCQQGKQPQWIDCDQYTP